MILINLKMLNQVIWWIGTSRKSTQQLKATSF